MLKPCSKIIENKTPGGGQRTQVLLNTDIAVLDFLEVARGLCQHGALAEAAGLEVGHEVVEILVALLDDVAAFLLAADVVAALLLFGQVPAGQGGGSGFGCRRSAAAFARVVVGEVVGGVGDGGGARVFDDGVVVVGAGLVVEVGRGVLGVVIVFAALGLATLGLGFGVRVGGECVVHDCGIVLLHGGGIDLVVTSVQIRGVGDRGVDRRHAVVS